jgi:uncharacterized membrane protein
MEDLRVGDVAVLLSQYKLLARAFDLLTVPVSDHPPTAAAAADDGDDASGGGSGGGVTAAAGGGGGGGGGATTTRDLLGNFFS